MTPKFNKFIQLICLLAFFSAFAQKVSNTDKHVEMLIKKAGEHLMNLECDKSIKVAQTALAEALKNKNNLQIARSYNIIGLNFDEFSDYKKAIDFYTKGLDYANRADNDTLKEWLHNNLGNVYTYRKVNFQEGIKHYKIALDLTKKMNDKHEILFTNINITSAYFAIHDYQKGLPFLKSAESLAKNQKSIEAELSINSLYGSYYTSVNDFDNAENSFKKALAVSKKNENKFLAINSAEIYDDYSRSLYKKGDYKRAYELSEKYNELKDQIYNEERTASTQKAGAQVELDEYKRQINKIENENVVYHRKFEQSKLIVILCVVLVIVLLLFMLSLYKNYKRRIEINKQLKAANEELFHAKIKAEEASRLKEQFISTVSHELRTPLYGVVGITDLLADEHHQLKESKYIKSLQFSAKYLLSLVNDILQVYKIEEKKITIENSVFNLSDELNSIIESLQFLAIKNNNKLKLEIDENIPEFLISDKVRLSQIFMNLITNSLKFTENGFVKVIAKQLRFESHFSFIQFKVIDNGIGIKKENQQKIFEKFVQLERRSDDYQGTGLGLPIVKQLIEIFGGHIEVESEESVGTTMSFTLAFDTDEQRRNQMLLNLDVDFSEEHVYKILVVEDNKINQIVTKKILDVRHFESKIANDGYEAVSLLEKESFDVILMDINMPKIDGFETTKLIRQKNIETPIIALTAFDRHEILEKALQSGMNEVIVKPFEPNQLYKMIVNLSDKNKLS